MAAFIGVLFGAFIGSFLNVCVHRLPRNESIVHPPSRCYACGARVRWYDNLPVLSWLLLRGRCRWCGTAYSLRYLVFELLVAALTGAVLWWVFTGDAPLADWMQTAGWSPWLVEGAAAAALLCLGWFLVVATQIDLEHLIIPDELTKSFQLVAPALALAVGIADFGWNASAWLWRVDVFGDLHLDRAGFLWRALGTAGGAVAFLLLSIPIARWVYARYCPEHERWREEDHRGFRLGVLWFCATVVLHGGVIAVLAGSTSPAVQAATAHLAHALLGSLAGWLSLYLVGLIGTVVFRKNAMGFGDVKFLAPIGAFLGPVGVLYAFFGAAVAGSLIGLPMYLLRRKRQIPFGPYLALGTAIALALGPWLHGRWFG